MRIFGMKERHTGMLVGALLVLSGMLLMTPLNGNNRLMSIIIGICAIVKGLSNTMSGRFIDREYGISLRSLSVAGSVDLVVGLLLTFSPYLNLDSIVYGFTFMYIINALTRLSAIFRLGTQDSDSYAVIIGLDNLELALGIIMLFNPLFSDYIVKFLVGCYLIGSGFIQIIAADKVLKREVQ